MPGMREVAKRAGVSLSTVSAVLSDSGKYVSEEIREKVMETARELGYRLPERRKKKDKIIAVVLPHIASTFFSNLLNGIEDTVAENGYILVVGNSDFNFEKEKKFMKMIRKQALCGILIDTVCPVTEEKEYFGYIKETFLERQIPVVMLEKKAGEAGFGSVYVDHEKNAYMATHQLLERGHRHIGHIAGRMDNPLSLFRLQGYKRALAEFDIPYSVDLVAEGDFTPNSGYMMAKELIIRNSGMTAIFAANDQMAIGAIKAVHSEGKKIPDEFAVTGIDNLSASSMIEPSLTTINVPTYQMGRIAVKMLTDSDAKEKNVELPCNLIVRKSTNKLAASEWELFGW